MKHITLLLTILFATQIAFAQEEVSIEQNINQCIKKLVINPGWDVHLIHQEADSGYRVAIITNEDYAPFAFNVQLCNVKDQALTILENTQLPQGTVIEIEGPMTFGEIILSSKATAVANYVATSRKEESAYLFLGNNANLHIQQFRIPDKDSSPNIDVSDCAKLTIDTISGEGDALVEVYEGTDFQYGINTLQGKITLIEYERAFNRRYRQKDKREIKTKKVDGEWVTTNHRIIWDKILQVDVVFGELYGNTPKDPNSPLLQNSTWSSKLGLNTYFNFSKHFGLSTGIMWNFNSKSLCHQVKYEDNELVVIDGQEDFQRNRLSNHYIGIPITFYYYLGKSQTESVSLDFYCAHLLGERLHTTTDPTKLFKWIGKGEKVDNVFNPWKLEVGLSFNTQHLGFIHGIRVFTNLLPEYKPDYTTEKIRSFGIEIKL